jgi:hypothetical protein
VTALRAVLAAATAAVLGDGDARRRGALSLLLLLVLAGGAGRAADAAGALAAAPVAGAHEPGAPLARQAGGRTPARAAATAIRRPRPLPVGAPRWLDCRCGGLPQPRAPDRG